MSDSSSNIMTVNFNHNTFVGYDLEEISKTTSDDLLMLRRAIYGYLSSDKLKKRNKNFITVYNNINKELVNRNVLKHSVKISKNVNSFFNTTKMTKKIEGLSDKNKAKHDEKDEKIKIKNTSNDDKLLKKKRSSTPKNKNYFSIPDFFNDKSNKDDSFQALQSDLLLKNKKTFKKEKGIIRPKIAKNNNGNTVLSDRVDIDTVFDLNQECKF